MSRTISFLRVLREMNILKLTESRKINPICLDNWPKYTYTNCFGFAIGDSSSIEIWEMTKFDMDPTLEIGEAVCRKLRMLNYKLPRRIMCLSEADGDEFVLAIFGFARSQEKVPLIGSKEVADYHVVRREPDGTWVHKPGWWQVPREITKEDGEEIRNKFDVSKVALFAFEAPSK